MQHGVINVMYYDVVKIVLSAKPILNLTWKCSSMDLKTIVHCLFCLSDKTEICLLFLEGNCIQPVGEFKRIDHILEPIA